MTNRAGLLTLLLLLGSGCADGVGSAVGDFGRERVGLCAPSTYMEQPKRRVAEDTCWRVEAAEGFGVTETGGNCKDAPRCLLTRSTAVERQLLDWEAEGEDNPVSWREVLCTDICP